MGEEPHPPVLGKTPKREERLNRAVKNDFIKWDRAELETYPK
jgi:hypothetical protein